MGIGETLREARRAKGLTIAVAEEETKIRAKFLEALENEAFSVLPGRVYAKAFLRTYARYLGLDDAALAQQFDLLYPVEEESSTPKAKRVRQVTKPVFAFDWGRYRNFFLVAGVITLLLLFNSFYGAVVFSLGERGKNDAGETQQVATRPQAEKKPVGAATQPEKKLPAGRQVAENPAPLNGQTASAQPVNGGARGDEAAGPAAHESPVPQGVELKLSVTQDRCWMRVITDGTVAFEGEVRAGEVRTFAAKSQIHLRLGNAGVVKVSYNGQELGYLGAVGQVVTREFSASQG